MRQAIIVSALLLAACGGGSENANTATEESAAQPIVQEAVPENLMDDPRNEAVPLEAPAPAASASPVAAFPASFQGRWGMVPADCEPGRADAKGLMEVGADSLRFYESRGRATKLSQTAPGQIEATLAFTGEGQNWTSTQALTLLQGGRTLVREERDPAGSFRYSRCPDAK